MPDRAPHTTPGLNRLNTMSENDALEAFHGCCGCRLWAAAMASLRPFSSVDGLYGAATDQWNRLGPSEWQEAFSHHPRIGETDLNQAKFAATAQQSSGEQSGMARATPEVRAAFVAGNSAYEGKFGHVFLICATGRSGAEMLEQLHARLENDAATELSNAAAQQAMITRIRLERLVQS